MSKANDQALVDIEVAANLLGISQADLVAAVDNGTIPGYVIDDRLCFWPDELAAIVHVSGR